MDPKKVFHHNLSFDCPVLDEQGFTKHGFPETTKKIWTIPLMVLFRRVAFPRSGTILYSRHHEHNDNVWGKLKMLKFLASLSCPSL